MISIKPQMDEATKLKIQELEKQVEKIKVELKRDAKRGCKKCDGLGYTGVNKDTFVVQTCSCVFKNREKAAKNAPKQESKIETVKAPKQAESKIETVKAE
jgi:RNase P subunit RPR2